MPVDHRPRLSPRQNEAESSPPESVKCIYHSYILEYTYPYYVNLKNALKILIFP
jgi:hypothetical protein